MPPAVNHLHGDRLTVQASSALVVVSPDRSEHLLTRVEKITDIQLNTQLWSSFMPSSMYLSIKSSLFYSCAHQERDFSEEQGLFNLMSMSIHSSIYLYIPPCVMFPVSYTLSPPLYIYIYMNYCSKVWVILYSIFIRIFLFSKDALN